ncbi:hypothetical protein ACOMHN_046195 [Nucella lapillus]
MAPSLLLPSLLMILAVCFSHASKTSLPEGMHQDMYCIGCEMTMKVVDRALKNIARNQVTEAVTEALDKVCQPDHFEISEYSKDTVNAACQHLVEHYGPELRRELVSQYQRAKQDSYLDLVKQVCMTLTDACHGVLHDDHDHDPLMDDARVKMDPETNEFVVLPGKNLKVARPVSPQGHEEL